MSRNARSYVYENGRFNEISSNLVNIYGFGDIGEFFSRIRQSEISLVDLKILTNFRHFRYCMHFWTYFSQLSSRQQEEQ